MFISSLILAVSSSIDSLGIGITYGIKETQISYISKVILFMISFFITIVAIWFGDTIKSILPSFLVNIIGSCILIGMGSFIIFQSLKKEDTNEKEYINSEEKIYSFFIQFLGITIKIIKNPISSDLDKSNLIEPKEAIFLGLALSLDSFCIGIGGSIIGINSFYFPVLIGIFQLLFLSLGNFLGNKINNLSNLPQNTWSTISGALLILIGLVKLFI